MSFSNFVERWRSTVETQLERIFEEMPQRKSLVNALGLTFPRLVDILLGIIAVESSGNPQWVGDDGKSVGLMQLNYDSGTPQGEGYTGDKEGLKDPEKNIYFGTRYFLRQLKRYSNLEKAVLAYNAGSFRKKEGVPVNISYLEKLTLALTGQKKRSLPVA